MVLWLEQALAGQEVPQPQQIYFLQVVENYWEPADLKLFFNFVAS